MVKIFNVESRTEVRLILEGSLVAPWTADLRHECERLRADLQGRKLIVELRNLIAVNQEGENFLLHLIDEGVTLRCSGVFTKHILSELSRRVPQKRLPVTEQTWMENGPVGKNEMHGASYDFYRVS